MSLVTAFMGCSVAAALLRVMPHVGARREHHDDRPEYEEEIQKLLASCWTYVRSSDPGDGGDMQAGEQVASATS